MTFLDKELVCPHCGRVNDTHQGFEGQRPEAGDVGICWKCKGLTILTPFGFLRPPRDAVEAALLEQDPDVKRARAAMAEAYTPTQAVRLMKGER